MKNLKRILATLLVWVLLAPAANAQIFPPTWTIGGTGADLQPIDTTFTVGALAQPIGTAYIDNLVLSGSITGIDLQTAYNGGPAITIGAGGPVAISSPNAVDQIGLSITQLNTETANYGLSVASSGATAARFTNATAIVDLANAATNAFGTFRVSRTDSTAFPTANFSQNNLTNTGPTVSVTANGSGHGIIINNSGTGKDIYGNSGNWHIASNGDAYFSGKLTVDGVIDPTDVILNNGVYDNIKIGRNLAAAPLPFTAESGMVVYEPTGTAVTALGRIDVGGGNYVNAIGAITGPTDIGSILTAVDPTGEDVAAISTMEGIVLGSDNADTASGRFIRVKDGAGDYRFSVDGSNGDTTIGGNLTVSGGLSATLATPVLIGSGTSTEVIQDGDMEYADTAYWSVFTGPSPYNTTLSKDTGTVHAGTRSLKVEAIAGGGGLLNGTAQGGFTPGISYDVSLWLYGDGVNVVAVQIAGSPSYSAVVPAAWTQVTFTATASTSGYLWIYSPSAAPGQAFYVDDVSAVPSSTDITIILDGENGDVINNGDIHSRGAGTSTFNGDVNVGYAGDSNPDGDMEAAGTSAYTAIGATTLSKDNVIFHGGTQSLKALSGAAGNIGAVTASTVMETGETYTISGWARSDGNSIPLVSTGGAPKWIGQKTAIWQYFTFTQPADTQYLSLVGVVTAAGQEVWFDDVSVQPLNGVRSINLSQSGNISAYSQPTAAPAMSVQIGLYGSDNTNRFFTYTDWYGNGDNNYGIGHNFNDLLATSNGDLIIGNSDINNDETPSQGNFWLSNAFKSFAIGDNTFAAGVLTDSSFYYNGSTKAMGINDVGTTSKLSIVVDNTENLTGLKVNQGDSTNNPVALQIVNAGTGNDITADGWSVTSGALASFDRLFVAPYVGSYPLGPAVFVSDGTGTDMVKVMALPSANGGTHNRTGVDLISRSGSQYSQWMLDPAGNDSDNYIIAGAGWTDFYSDQNDGDIGIGRVDYSGTPTVMTDAGIFYDGANNRVGIGTITPADKLSVSNLSNAAGSGRALSSIRTKSGPPGDMAANYFELNDGAASAIDKVAEFYFNQTVAKSAQTSRGVYVRMSGNASDSGGTYNGIDIAGFTGSTASTTRHAQYIDATNWKNGALTIDVPDAQSGTAGNSAFSINANNTSQSGTLMYVTSAASTAASNPMVYLLASDANFDEPILKLQSNSATEAGARFVYNDGTLDRFTIGSDGTTAINSGINNTVSLTLDPAATGAHLSLTGVTTDPTPSEGWFWYNNSTDRLKLRKSSNIHTAAFFDEDDHLYGISATPSVSSCGTGPSITGNDTAGTVTEGTVATGCTITFATAYNSTPSCVVTSQAGLVFSYATTTTDITITNVGALSSTALDYHCIAL